MSDFTLNFNDEEIEFIIDKGFYEFNGINVNIKKRDNGNNILMDLLLFLNISISVEEIESLLVMISKLILNEDFNINSENNNGTTVLSNIIQLGISSEILEYILENRNDMNINQYETRYGKTYIDLAMAFERYDIVEIIKKRTKRSIEELISDRDFSGIVNYCKNGTLMGTTQEIASGLYNVANQVGQYYNDNELAIKLYKESIKYNEKDPTVYNNLATSYKRLGEYDNALKNYLLSLKHDSKNPIRYLRPALLYAYIGDKSNALDFLESYFNIGGNKLSFKELCKNTTEGGNELLKLYNTF